MNIHRVTNFLISAGYWTHITVTETDVHRVCFIAYDEDGAEVDLMVTEENEEYVVYQSYSNEAWTLVDTP